MSNQPIYTRHNCKVAFQLNWSLSIFWRNGIDNDGWLDVLKQQTESDGVRLLEHRFPRPQHSLFLLSTKPHVAPSEAARSVKGRLQYILRRSRPKAFQRNYSIRSLGSTRREKLDEYLAQQVAHHPIADDRVRKRFEAYQIYQPDVDLSRARFGAHAQFWHNLHICFVNTGRWRDIDEHTICGTRDTILRASRVKGHLLSRGGILPDHIHVALGCGLQDAPIDVALSYMNNLAHAQGMRPVFQFSLYVGTFGEFDLGAIEPGYLGS